MSVCRGFKHGNRRFVWVCMSVWVGVGVYGGVYEYMGVCMCVGVYGWV